MMMIIISSTIINILRNTILKNNLFAQARSDTSEKKRKQKLPPLELFKTHLDVFLGVVL